MEGLQVIHPLDSDDDNVDTLAAEIVGRSAVNEIIKRSLATPHAHLNDYLADQLLPYILTLLHSVYHTLKDANGKVSLSAIEVLRCKTTEAALQQSSRLMEQRLEQMEKLPRLLIADLAECMLESLMRDLSRLNENYILFSCDSRL